MEHQGLKLSDVEFELRRAYAVAHRHGVTYEDMEEVTGLPMSTFSMWLRGYRPITKLRQLQALIDNAHIVEAKGME